jgi:hypothetical protein
MDECENGDGLQTEEAEEAQSRAACSLSLYRLSYQYSLKLTNIALFSSKFKINPFFFLFLQLSAYESCVLLSINNFIS